MAKNSGGFFNSFLQRRMARQWAKAARGADTANLSTLRGQRGHARQLRQHLDTLIARAEHRLALPIIGGKVAVEFNIREALHLDVGHNIAFPNVFTQLNRNRGDDTVAPTRERKQEFSRFTRTAGFAQNAAAKGNGRIGAEHQFIRIGTNGCDFLARHTDAIGAGLLAL